MERRRWLILAIGTYAQAACCAFVYGAPMLLPALRDRGVGLVAATLLVDAPVVGLMLTLYAWGVAADRRGERRVILTGVSVATAGLIAAASVGPLALVALFLGVAGLGGASAFAASGRLVMGWFPADERGLAMGIRQTSQPLGVALAAVLLPPLAHGPGLGWAVASLAGLCALAVLLVLAFAVDPPRPAGRGASADPAGGSTPTVSPYRRGSALIRVHLSSTLLVVPQFAVSVFTLTYLVEQRHWDPTAAGRLILGFQVAGALGRVASGVWSDRVGSRLRPMRRLAVAAAVLMGLLALGAWTGGGWIVAVFGLAAVVTVADNGLAYTSVAELAGREWSGRALGLHNTVQNVAAVATPPVLAVLVGASGYAPAFLVVVIAPVLSALTTPVWAERRGTDSDAHGYQLSRPG